MTLKDIQKFAENFAYDFISNECMEKEFANIKCGDAQNWLIENGIEIKD